MKQGQHLYMHNRIIFLKILTYVLFVFLAIFTFLFSPFKHIDHFTEIHYHTKGCGEIESKKICVWLGCHKSFILLKYLEGLRHNNYLGKTSWKHREGVEKGNCIFLSCILFSGPLITGLKKTTYRSERGRVDRSKGTQWSLSSLLGYCLAGGLNGCIMCIGLRSLGSLEDTNMFSHAFEVAEMLFCLLLLHRSNLESFSAVRIRGRTSASWIWLRSKLFLYFGIIKDLKIYKHCKWKAGHPRVYLFFKK